jgi:hypothetical protein
MTTSLITAGFPSRDGRGRAKKPEKTVIETVHYAPETGVTVK